jgi:flagellar basal-body rod protein FlgC
MDVISENIANAQTSETAEGGPYRRKVCVLSERTESPFSSVFSKAVTSAAGNGVKISRIVEDQSDFELEYDPDSPLAGPDGYVRMPNVDEVEELIDLMSATRSYEANVTALDATKSMALKALEIGR